MMMKKCLFAAALVLTLPVYSQFPEDDVFRDPTEGEQPRVIEQRKHHHDDDEFRSNRDYDTEGYDHDRQYRHHEEGNDRYQE